MLPEEQAPHPATEPVPALGWSDLAMGLGLIIAAELLLALAFLPWMSFEDPSLSPREAAALGMQTLLTFVVMAAIAWYFLCVKQGVPLATGLDLVKLQSTAVRRYTIIGVAMAAVFGGLSGFVSSGNSPLSELVTDPNGRLVIAASALTAPVAEEFFFRGFIYGVIRARAGARLALWVTTLVFGGAHVLQLAGDWLVIPLVVTAGFILTWVRHRTGVLTPSIVIHLAYNATVAFLSFMFPE